MDLNADLGEGFGAWRLGDDEALLDLVTSANVACGFHAGDPVTMRRVCGWAADRGVAIGAQVGYRDLAGFGRRRIDYDPAELRDEIIYQIAALDGFCRLQGDRVRYVKPHGALYNTAAVDAGQASAIVAAIVDYDRQAAGAVPAGLSRSAAGRARGRAAGGRRGLRRPGLPPDGTLVPRGQPGAVLSDVDAVVARSRAGWRRRARWRRRTARSSRARWSRCACTATPRARSNWPAASAPLCRAAGVTPPPFTCRRR